MTYELIEADSLFPHQEIDFENYEIVNEGIADTQVIEKAILVDKKSNVIIDGHHRYTVLQDLGCRHVPVVFVNYVQDSSIQLDFYPNKEYLRCSKEELIKRAQRGKLFPYRTTKHTHNINIVCNVEIERLM